MTAFNKFMAALTIGCFLAFNGILALAQNGQIPGTSTNDSALTSNVGEYVSSTLIVSAAFFVTNNTPANLTSISLTAGDWDVQAEGIFICDASTTINALYVGVTTASATAGGVSGTFGQWAGTNTIVSDHISVLTPQVRVSLAAVTTIYGVALAKFAVSTCAVYGILRARRMR